MKKGLYYRICILRKPMSLFAFLAAPSECGSGFRATLFFASQKNLARSALKTRSETHLLSFLSTRLPLLINFLVGVFFIALPALAIEYNLLAPIKDKASVEGANIFGQYMASFIPFVLAFAAVAAVTQIVIGGFEYALSEAITNKQEAKDRITSALSGLLLALASFLILNTINPKLTSLQLEVKPLNAPSTQSQQQQTNPSTPTTAVPTANTVFGQQEISATDWQLQQLGLNGWTTINVFKIEDECKSKLSVLFPDRCVQQQQQVTTTPPATRPWILQIQQPDGIWINEATFEKEEECEGRKQNMIQVDPSRVTTVRCIRQ